MVTGGDGQKNDYHPSERDIIPYSGGKQIAEVYFNNDSTAAFSAERYSTSFS